MLSRIQIGQLIKKARDIKSVNLGKKYTQSDLANDIELSRSYVGDIERGRVSVDFGILTKISNACDVKIDFFTLNTDEDFNEKIMEDPSKYKDIVQKPASPLGSNDIISGLIKTLIQQNVIKDENNIDKETLDLLISALKIQIKIEKEKMQK